MLKARFHATFFRVLSLYKLKFLSEILRLKHMVFCLIPEEDEVDTVRVLCMHTQTHSPSD